MLKNAQVLTAYSGSSDYPLGMSLGIAVQEPGSDETMEALMARADWAMYASKQKGKGQFTIDPAPSGVNQRGVS